MVWLVFVPLLSCDISVLHSFVVVVVGIENILWFSVIFVSCEIKNLGKLTEKHFEHTRYAQQPL